MLQIPFNSASHISEPAWGSIKKLATPIDIDLENILTTARSVSDALTKYSDGKPDGKHHKNTCKV